jgi:hypothetical protein
MNSQGSDFADEIVQDKLPTHTESPRDTFLPWHRPKKEFIRRFQWNALTARMIKRHWKQELKLGKSEWSLDDDENAEAGFKLPAHFAQEHCLRCLVIPGEDLLDLRALWRDIQDLNCHICYLGFNEGHGSDQKGTRIHISNNAVTSLPRVLRHSRVLHDRFEAVANENSIALRYLKEYGPYHVVNLDLCGSMFPNTVKATQEYYDALLQVLTYQFEKQKTEWLLFITTMIEPAVVDVNNLQALCGPTRENFSKYHDFAEVIIKIIPEKTFPNTGAPMDLAALSEAQMVKLFGIAFGKWLLALCQKAKPQWTVAMRRSYCHTINETKGAVMLSLAFELKPNIAPPVDTTGMTKLQLPAKEYPSEQVCALKLAESVAKICDVDSELDGNKKLKGELRDAQAELLESAGYDRVKYVKWVDAGEKVLR